jgi:hypothetical protein
LSQLVHLDTLVAAIRGARVRGKARVRSPRRWRSVVGECARLIDRRQRMLSALVASVRGCIRDAWL